MCIEFKVSPRSMSLDCTLDDLEYFLLKRLHRKVGVMRSSEIAPEIEADRSEKALSLTKDEQAYDEKASSKQPHLHVRPVVPNAP